MGTLKLWAVGIDEVREIFSANPEVAERLRAAAVARFRTDLPRPRGLLGKLGPLLRPANDPAAPRPGVPGPEDVEDLLAGRHILPQRLSQAWTLLEFWIGALSWGSGEWSLTTTGLRELDFDLARAGIPARYSVSDLFANGLGVSLSRCENLAAGYVRAEQAHQMADAWAVGTPALEPDNQPAATEITDFLRHWPEWAVLAAQHSRPEPDLVATFRG
jgi:hypothetical protein